MAILETDTTETPPKRRTNCRIFRWAAELVFVAAVSVAAVSASWPVLHFHEHALPPDIASYFRMFNVSAMMGTGHGMVRGSEDQLPELKAFLFGRTSQLVLPKVEPSQLGGWYNESFLISHCYLILSLGGWWRLMGVSMHTFMLFAAFVYAVAAVLLYALFRLGCGRFAALLGVLCVVTSPLWLNMAPSLRDFAKAPFVLAFLLSAAWAATRSFSGRGLAAWALATGIGLGFGWGFRQDLLACFLPALLLPWVVRVVGQGAWRWRAASCALMLAAITTVGFPVIHAMRGDSGMVTVHTLMQGFSEQSESAMSFGNAGYVQHENWNDPLAHAVVAAYAARQGNFPPMGGFQSPSYVAAGRRYISETLRTFPADFFRRGLASAFSIPDVAADACRANNAPLPNLSPWISWWARIHAPLAAHMERFGVLYVLLALTVGFAVNFRAAVILVVLGIYIGAYPNLLFQSRHVFHLTFVPYWAVLWLFAVAGNAMVRRLRAGLGGHGFPWRVMLRASAGIAAFLGILVATGWFLDRVQERSVNRLLERYRGASLEPVSFRETPYKDGWVLVEPLMPVSGLGTAAKVAPYETGQALLALQLDWAPPVFPVRMVYEEGLVTNFTQDVYPLVKDPSKDTALTCFLPVLELNWPAAANVDEGGGGVAEKGRFVGIAVPACRREQVRGLFRVANAAQFPLHLFMTVPDAPSQFIGRKGGPWSRQCELYWSEWGGTRESVVDGLCQSAQRHPYDTRLRDALETFVKAHRDPLVWKKAWPILALLDPDHRSEAGLVLDRYAEEFMTSGDMETAVELYRMAIEVAPDLQWHKLNLAKAFEHSGRGKDALALYLDMLAYEPESPELADRVDQIFGAEKDRAGRVAAWQSLAGKQPSAFVPAHHLALAYTASGDLDKALAEHERAFRISPEHSSQLLDYGKALLDAGQWPQAAEMFHKAAAGDRTLAPNGAEQCAKAADDRLKAGDSQHAVWLYRQAIDLHPEDRWLRVETAAAMKTAGDTQGALDVLLEAMGQMPDGYVALQIDQLLESGATPEERVSRWASLAAAHAGCLECRVHLGMALEKAGKPGEAQREYEAALQTDPNCQSARVHLGSLLLAGGHSEEGLPLIVQAVAADPSLALPAGQACADAAARKVGDGDLKPAEELYRRAVAFAPNDGWYRVRLGEVMEREEKPGEAAAEYGKLLQEMPDSPHCAARFDDLLAKGTPEARLSAWNALSQSHPDAAIPLFYLGKTLESLERWEDAAAAYQAAFKINAGLRDAWIAGAVQDISAENAVQRLNRLKCMAQIPGLPKEGVIAAFDDVARRFREKGQANLAVEIYRNALAVFPEAPPLLFGLSEALDGAGDRTGAKDACVRLLKAVPESPKTAKRLDALFDPEGTEAASRTEVWKGIVQAHPGAAIPCLHFGLALEKAGDVAGAETVYREVLSRDSKIEFDSPLFSQLQSLAKGTQ